MTKFVPSSAATPGGVSDCAPADAPPILPTGVERQGVNAPYTALTVGGDGTPVVPDRQNPACADWRLLVCADCPWSVPFVVRGAEAQAAKHAWTAHRRFRTAAELRPVTPTQGDAA